MNELMDLVRRAVREELALHRGPQLATVTALSAHESDDDTNNYECDVRLKHDGLELPKVPIAVPHIGIAAPPRVGDLVLLSFLDHDIQQPLVTGRFYHDQERAPLFKEDDVLFEHRLPDGTINHLRMAADGSLFLQRDVTKPEDNSEFKAGFRIDPDGLIELKSGDDFVLTIDPQNSKITLLAKDNNVEITCGKLLVDGDVEIKKALTVDGDGTIKGTGKISSVTISGTTISG
jgi:phage baseplate assembly protein gpV